MKFKWPCHDSSILLSLIAVVNIFLTFISSKWKEVSTNCNTIKTKPDKLNYMWNKQQNGYSKACTEINSCVTVNENKLVSLQQYW